MPDQLTKDPRLEVAYAPIWTTLNRLKDETEATSHDITTKAGHAAAVTLVANLRKERKPITDAHKAIKADALEFGRMVDNEKNMAIALLDETIAIYADPIRERKEAEAARVAAIRAMMDAMKVGPDIAGHPSADIIARQSEIQGVIIGEAFAEFGDEAAIMKTAALRYLSEAIEKATKREADAAELEAGRKKLAEQAEQLRINAAAEAARVEAERVAAAKVKAAEDKAKAATALADQAKAETARVAQQAIDEKKEEEARRILEKNGMIARKQEQADREARKAASLEDKCAAVLEEVGAFIGEREAEALWNGMAAGNITSVVPA